MSIRYLTSILLGLALGSCGSQPGDQSENEAVAQLTANEKAADQPKLPPCPFRNTSDWHASIENGRLLVNGEVDLLMAGFKPTLTPRGGGDFDLSLEPEQGAVVNDRARYEAPATASYRQVRIYCGGEPIETIDVVHVG